MELDKRIKDIDTIQTILKHNANDIGCKGYFFDNYVQAKVLTKTHYGTLVDIDNNDDNDLCFKARDKNGNDFVGYFRLFIPEDALKPAEKKYRPFSLNEFTELYDIGDVVTYRIKDCEVIKQSMFIGCQSRNDEDAPGNGYVVIGNCKYSLKELFNHYELQYLAHWQPFGILEEE